LRGRAQRQSQERPNEPPVGDRFGATARRLSKPAFSAYLNAVLADPFIALKKEGIKLMSAASSTQYFQFFTEQDEANLRYALGSYYNAIARDRDAARLPARCESDVVPEREWRGSESPVPFS